MTKTPIEHPVRETSMRFDLAQATEVLARTPSVLRAMLSGLNDAWITHNYGPETWSPFDVVGHLIHGERSDWITRARVILEHQDKRAFEPFDRYAQYHESAGKTIEQLLDEFATLRAANLRQIKEMNLSAEQLDLPGRHPALGAVTLRNLLAAWVVHDLNHIHQIAKAMAYQYRDEVGAWREYLSILPAETGKSA